MVSLRGNYNVCLVHPYDNIFCSRRIYKSVVKVSPSKYLKTQVGRCNKFTRIQFKRKVDGVGPFDNRHLTSYLSTYFVCACQKKSLPKFVVDV